VQQVPARPWIHPELSDPDGLCGVGGDLLPATLIHAYCEGVFPWFNEGDPILWWSPDPRAIFDLERIHIPRRLARTVRQGKFTITINRAFEQVMRGCGVRPEGTWITSSMREAYSRLHRLGHAHSLEAWQDGQLAGGLYGVALGGLFAAESMFHIEPDAANVCFVHLVDRLKQRGYVLLDTQMATPHTKRFGAFEIPRRDYLKRLHRATPLATRFL
jgi:leucyl/phenylalanyl-tRNA--protein transferase